MKNIIQIIVTIIFSFTQCNFTLAQPNSTTTSTALDEKNKTIESSYHDKMTLTEFIEKNVHADSDKAFLLSKAYKNKIEKSLVPKFKIRKSPSEYIFTFNSKNLLKISRYNPNAVTLSGKKIDLSKLKNISEIYDVVTIALEAKTSWFEFLIPNAYSSGWVPMVVIAMQVTGCIASFAVPATRPKGVPKPLNYPINISSFRCENGLPANITFGSGMVMDLNYNLNNKIDNFNLAFLNVDCKYATPNNKFFLDSESQECIDLLNDKLINPFNTNLKSNSSTDGGSPLANITRFDRRKVSEFLDRVVGLEKIRSSADCTQTIRGGSDIEPAAK